MLNNPEYIYSFIIKPARVLLAEVWHDPHPESADVLLLAIAQQESGCCARLQRGGTARSLWQIEGPTCSAVLERWTPLARCLSRVWIEPAYSLANNHPWLAWHDVAAFWTARGILALDPEPLPYPDNEAGAWNCYIKNWRPGKPRPDDWAESHATALVTYYSGKTQPII